MSDRLEDLRNRHGKPWAYHDQEWALAEIDRLRANQIPGRCGECAAWQAMDGNLKGRGLCESRNLDQWPERGFCHEFKPKGE